MFNQARTKMKIHQEKRHRVFVLKRSKIPNDRFNLILPDRFK